MESKVVKGCHVETRYSRQGFPIQLLVKDVPGKKSFDMSVLRSCLMAAEMAMRKNDIPLETVEVEFTPKGLKINFSIAKAGKIGTGHIDCLDLDHMHEAVKLEELK